ncbi:hypothetical protein ACFFJY_17310 [Fictibacillus aquaticus]|uniref:Uncharacterized protein n=1 Tax=Fictibacillus aquaticus TaxID=2021314 RepID=A0A235F7M5_9BACL|nr:hypothetical protein [Fictibacillus aquaticus]OYD56695.1 hypothetical protein CGZ90_16945 [Fictibacillus aquaticus]
MKITPLIFCVFLVVVALGFACVYMLVETLKEGEYFSALLALLIIYFVVNLLIVFFRYTKWITEKKDEKRSDKEI